MKEDDYEEELRELNEMMDCIHEVDVNLAIEQIPNQVLLLMGQTKAGKTTLLYYLLKKKLIYEKDQMKNLNVMKPEILFQHAQIGNNYDSTTVYPNIPPETDDDCLIIDMPGLNDTRANFRLLNIYIIQETIKKIKNVHVSIVIPFESLEGDDLKGALQKTCSLFNPIFLKEKKCKSFILTKIENEEEDQEHFIEQMSMLKQELEQSEEDDGVRVIIDSFQQTNTYLFCNKEPDQEKGGLLKEQIMRENNFFNMKDSSTSVLASQYAELIVGRGNIQEFNQYALDMIKKIRANFDLLIDLYVELVKFHHFSLLKECNRWNFNINATRQSILDIRRKLFIGNINEKQCQLEETIHDNRADQILSLMYKIKRSEESEKQQGFNFGQLRKFVEFSSFFATQKSGISQELRKGLHFTLKNCYTILKLIESVKEESLHNELKKFELNQQEQQKNQVVQGLYSSQLIRYISERPEATNLIGENDFFRRVILSEIPDFKITEVVKTVKLATNNKLKKKDWEKSFLDITKSHDNVPQKQQKNLDYNSFIPSINNSIEACVRTLNKIKSSKDNLDSLIRVINSSREEKKKSPDMFGYQRQLWSKTSTILFDLNLTEEAILMSLSIPDEIVAESQMDTAIQYGLLSGEFVKNILLPYYSTKELSFDQIEKFYNYLSVRCSTIEAQIELENSYVHYMTKMRQTLAKKDLVKKNHFKRFNYNLIDGFTLEMNRDQLLRTAWQNEKKIKKSILFQSVSKKRLQDLHHLSQEQ